MRKIYLTKGRFTIVDDEDFNIFNTVKWFFDGQYAARKSPKKIYLHRLINKTPRGILTDHINKDTLDNRRINLRNATRQLNSINRKLQKNNSSGFKGVTWSKRDNKWQSQIKINQKNINLGCFITKEEAMEKRKLAEQKYYESC